MDITATLKDATLEGVRDLFFLWGTIYGDTRGRFADGTRIHTSIIAKKIDDNTFATRSGNTYHVESWRYPPKIQRDPGDENDHPEAP